MIIIYKYDLKRELMLHNFDERYIKKVFNFLGCVRKYSDNYLKIKEYNKKFYIINFI